MKRKHVLLLTFSLIALLLLAAVVIRNSWLDNYYQDHFQIWRESPHYRYSPQNMEELADRARFISLRHKPQEDVLTVVLPADELVWNEGHIRVTVSYYSEADGKWYDVYDNMRYSLKGVDEPEDPYNLSPAETLRLELELPPGLLLREGRYLLTTSLESACEITVDHPFLTDRRVDGYYPTESGFPMWEEPSEVEPIGQYQDVELCFDQIAEEKTGKALYEKQAELHTKEGEPVLYNPDDFQVEFFSEVEGGWDKVFQPGLDRLTGYETNWLTYCVPENLFWKPGQYRIAVPGVGYCPITIE